MTEYPNWFAHYAEGFFAKHLAPLAGQPGLRFLQIGAFTGDASAWLLENILTGNGSHLVDVDTWAGSDEPEHEAFEWADVERSYDERMAGYRPDRLVKVKATSDRYLATPAGEFDFIYIDGDHTAPGVLSDALGAFRLLKPGGLLAFDDYSWKPSNGGGETKAPAAAVDAFQTCYADRLQLLTLGLQAWFRKLS